MFPSSGLCGVGLAIKREVVIDVIPMPVIQYGGHSYMLLKTVRLYSKAPARSIRLPVDMGVAATRPSSPPLFVFRYAFLVLVAVLG